MLPFVQSSYLSALLESFSSGVLIMNTRNDVYAANQTAAELLERPSGLLVGTHFAGPALGGFEKPAKIDDLIENTKRSGTPSRDLLCGFWRQSGELAYYSLSSSLLTEYGKTFGIVLQIVDVTPIYKMHERERRILEEINLAQLERLSSLNKFSMGVAHQIRNPLTSIGGMAGLLCRKIPPELRLEPYLEAITDGARRLEAIVRAVSEYCEPHRPELKNVNLAKLAAEAAEVANLRLANGVKLTLCQRLKRAHWKLDPGLTRMALTEIMLNSAEFAAERAPVLEITGKKHAAGLNLQLDDNGPGLSPEALRFAFDPFYSTKSVGLGMGLTKARRWLSEQGASISLSNLAPLGTRASISLAAPEAT